MKISISISKAVQLPKVICGFPGVGKSTLFKQCKEKGMKVLDSDSSTFDKSDFPANYMQHIQDKTAKGYTILASSHQEVRDALAAEGIKFVLAYPSVDCKAEYLQRYVNRGSPESFVKLLDKNWETWIEGCNEQSSDECFHYHLEQGEFLSLDELAEDFSRDV